MHAAMCAVCVFGSGFYRACTRHIWKLCSLYALRGDGGVACRACGKWNKKFWSDGFRVVSLDMMRPTNGPHPGISVVHSQMELWYMQFSVSFVHANILISFEPELKFESAHTLVSVSGAVSTLVYLSLWSYMFKQNIFHVYGTTFSLFFSFYNCLCLRKRFNAIIVYWEEFTDKMICRELFKDFQAWLR